MAGKSNRRCYLSAYRYAPDRPPVFEDFGENLTLSGAVFQGAGSTLVIMFPSLEFDANFEVAYPDIVEWNELLKQTDNPELYVGEMGGLNKILHRKQEYALSGDTQQKVWARDNFQCVFCHRKMGDILMTIDHFYPMESGGVNDDTNYVTACRRCNKDKGMMMPQDFCKVKRFDFESIKAHLESVSRR